MNNSKKINVNISSLVGLKAELLRKKAEVENAKEQIDGTIMKPKVKIKNKKSKVKEEKLNKKKEVIELEDVNTLKKSKYMLEAKARLYNKLKNSRGDENHHFLVDFEHKSSDSADEYVKDDDYEDDNSDPEEDWVEYQDYFGRSRKCLRKDLPKMKEKDKLIKKEISNKAEGEKIDDHPPQPIFVLPVKEPEIEIMRKKWEEQTEKLAFKTDIHYQDILFDEARSHGVGYYGFSHDEEERAKQQANLAKLRKETEQRQNELKKNQEIKNKMEENRLKLARIRQRVRAGLPAEPTEEENVTKADGVAESKSKKDEPKEEITSPLEVSSEPEKVENNTEPQEENSLAVIEDKIKAFGELLGKRPKWRELSQEEWVHKRRKDRLGEFAPTYDNFKSGGLLKSNKDNQLLLKESDQNDPLRIHCNGPEPTDLWESTGPQQENTDDEDSDNKKLDTTNVTATPSSFTYSETFLPVPPPIFDSSIPPPSIFSPTPFLPSLNTIPPPVVCNTSLSQSGSPGEMYNFIPYCANKDNTSQTHSSVVNNDFVNNKKTCGESSGEESDIIGPMPPSTINDNNLLAQIPLPNTEPPNTVQSCGLNAPKEDKDEKLSTEKEKESLNADKILAGLKYLREKFDQKYDD